MRFKCFVLICNCSVNHHLLNLFPVCEKVWLMQFSHWYSWLLITVKFNKTNRGERRGREILSCSMSFSKTGTEEGAKWGVFFLGSGLVVRMCIVVMRMKGDKFYVWWETWMFWLWAKQSWKWVGRLVQKCYVGKFQGWEGKGKVRGDFWSKLWDYAKECKKVSSKLIGLEWK